MAAFHVFDLVSRRVFAVCGTSTHVLALHEQLGLGGGGAGEPFSHVVESPYEEPRRRLHPASRVGGRARPEQIDNGLARRRPHVYEAHGTLIPERARIGLGIWTMLPIRGGRSRSLDGQGLSARWRRLRVHGIDA
jgi:hypothetical protein